MIRDLGEQAHATVEGPWWHQGPVGRPLLFCPSPSRGPGRYHHAGGPGAWYASSTMRASWSELFRHFTTTGVDPFEVRRRVGRVQIHNVRALDLTSNPVLQALGIDESNLTGDDYATCQELAEASRTLGFHAVLAPSAAAPGEKTLAVFPEPLDNGAATVSAERIQVPPISLIRALPRIRPVPGSAAAYADYLEDVARLTTAALRNRYQRRSR